MDKIIFGNCMAELQKSFGKQPEARIEGLFDSLYEFTDSEAILATKYLIREFIPKFNGHFPVPANFWAWKRLKLKMKAEKIIEFIKSNWWVTDINKTVDLQDGALHSTIRMFGRKELQYDDFWKYNTQKFIDSYISKIEYGDFDNKPMRGCLDVVEEIKSDFCLKLDFMVDKMLESDSARLLL